MNTTRRTVLKGATASGVLAALIGAGALRPTQVLAADWNKAAFEAKDTAGALKGIGAGAPTDSKDLVLKVPDIAENGAVVPVGIDSRITGTQSIALLIEKNPQPLAASFTIPAGTEANVSTRVKMGESSNVYALVKADGRFYMAKKEIKITLGGCGG